MLTDAAKKRRLHPDYVAFQKLMKWGPYLKHLWQLKEVLRSDTFKRFAALFPEDGQPGQLVMNETAQLEQRQQPHERDH